MLLLLHRSLSFTQVRMARLSTFTRRQRLTNRGRRFCLINVRRDSYTSYQTNLRVCDRQSMMVSCLAQATNAVTDAADAVLPGSAM